MNYFFEGFFKAAGKYDTLSSEARAAIPALARRYGLIGAGLGSVVGAGGGYLTSPEDADTKTKLKRAVAGGVGAALLAGGVGYGTGQVVGYKSLRKIRAAHKRTDNPLWADTSNALDIDDLRDMTGVAKKETLNDHILRGRIAGQEQKKYSQPNSVEDMIASAEEYLSGRGGLLKEEKSAEMWAARLLEVLHAQKGPKHTAELTDLLARLEKEGIKDHKGLGRVYHPDIHGGVSPLGTRYSEAFEALQAGKKAVIDDYYPDTRAWVKKKEVEMNQRLQSTIEKSPLWRYLKSEAPPEVLRSSSGTVVTSNRGLK